MARTMASHYLQEYHGCRKCTNFLSSPIVSFRVFLDTRHLMTSRESTMTSVDAYTQKQMTPAARLVRQRCAQELMTSQVPLSRDLGDARLGERGWRDGGGGGGRREEEGGGEGGEGEGLSKLLKIVNALLNDCGGTVCVHCSVPCSFSVLDDVIDPLLTDLLPPGSGCYDDNFERLCMTHELPRRHVIYRVKPRFRSGISTLRFPSLLPSNHGLVIPSQGQIQELVLRCSRDADVTMRKERQVDLDPAEEESVLPDFHHLKPVVSLYPSCRVHFHYADLNDFDTEQNTSEERRDSEVFEPRATDTESRGRRPQRDMQYAYSEVQGHKQNYGVKVANLWWNDLELPKVIAALCKQQRGGSVYLGIREEVTDSTLAWEEVGNFDLGLIFKGTRKKIWTDGGAAGGRDAPTVYGDADDDDDRTNDVSNLRHKADDVFHLARPEDVPVVPGRRTGVFVCEGVVLNQAQRDTLTRNLMDKIRNLMLWYPSYPHTDPVTLTFHPVKGGPNDACVVEAIVPHFPGLSFHDKQGPQSYVVETKGLSTELRPLMVCEYMDQVVKIHSGFALDSESNA